MKETLQIGQGEEKEGDPREGEGEKRYRRGKRRGEHRQEGEGKR